MEIRRTSKEIDSTRPQNFEGDKSINQRMNGFVENLGCSGLLRNDECNSCS